MLREIARGFGELLRLPPEGMADTLGEQATGDRAYARWDFARRGQDRA